MRLEDTPPITGSSMFCQLRTVFGSRKSKSMRVSGAGSVGCTVAGAGSGVELGMAVLVSKTWVAAVGCAIGATATAGSVAGAASFMGTGPATHAHNATTPTGIKTRSDCISGIYRQPVFVPAPKCSQRRSGQNQHLAQNYIALAVRKQRAAICVCNAQHHFVRARLGERVHYQVQLIAQ